MGQKIICLVTIHGVGFEQPPMNGTPGYADSLHERLSKYLDATLLGDDPKRERVQRGQSGPIYIQGFWPPGSESAEPELARLGQWDESQSRIIDIDKTPLAEGDARIVHIALVYTHLQGVGPQLESLYEASAMAALSLGQYAHIMCLTRVLFADVQAMFGHQAQDTSAVKSSLSVRTDPNFRHGKSTHPAPANPSGLIAVIRQLENDVAVYVCHNDARERVRDFVWEVLLRLARREDVAGIVVNAHSNGTVVAFDVLRQFPPDAIEKVLALVTSGSPLRKYASLFHWGTEVGSIQKVQQWTNFWDLKDPVGDPLALPASWHPGMDATVASDEPGLYEAIDVITGKKSQVLIKDYQINNVANSVGGGLQAHNYWDNEEEFVQPLAGLLQELAASQFGEVVVSR